MPVCAMFGSGDAPGLPVLQALLRDPQFAGKGCGE